jgi:LysM repeat protein
MAVTVRSGDTLSAIAARNGVSLSALLHANPSIKNANLIYPGQQIQIPGHNGQSSFQPSTKGAQYVVKSGDTLSSIGARYGVPYMDIARASGISNPNMIHPGQVLTIPGKTSTNTNPAHNPSTGPTQGPTGPSTPGAGGNALAIARSDLGRNISDLKYNGNLAADLDKWPGNNVCCANFVSAVLQKAGQIKPSEHNDNVVGLSNNLANDPNWRRADPSHLSPGDVVCFDVPGEGHFAHVEMFAGYVNGRPTFIGSNNVNSDGSQRITEGGAGYSIDAAYHYVG